MGSSRKIYRYGDKIHIAIPNYIDQLTIDWINSQPAIATKIWEILMKAAHNEIVQADPISVLKALGLDNIGALNELINGSQNTTKDRRKLTYTPQNFKVTEKIKTGSGEEGIDKIEDEYKTKILKKDIETLNTEKQITDNKYEENNNANIVQSSHSEIPEMNVESKEDAKELYRKDGHMNLKAMASNSGGGRRGLSRSLVRTQLDTNKPNLMEQEIFGNN